MFTLWDSSADPLAHQECVYRWSGYAENEHVHSLLRYVETHGERLRRKYLAWIHELGESRIEGKRVIEHLALEDGLSYWWMTLLAEKSPYKSPITDAIRILALEEIVVQQRPGKLRLVSSNRMLHDVLGEFCQRLGIDYEWHRIPNEPVQRFSLRRFIRTLPQPLRAFGSLTRYLVARWPFRHAEKSGWSGGDRSLFFCSYFCDTAPELADAGQFRSRYWQGLHGLIARLGLSGNWLQLYVEQPEGPTPPVAMDWVQGFNRKRQEQGFHTFLDAYLSWFVVLRVLKRWIELALISWRVRGIQQAFRPNGSQISLWPLMRGEWHTSMRGSAAINNLLSIELFDSALRDLPHQKKGFYLCENIAWERALIHAWRKHGHGQLVAAAIHVTVRFWDLRYFTDPRTIRSSDPYSMPQADFMALNGKAAIEAYLSADYPKEGIVECEAVRYGSLDDLREGHSSRKAEGGPIRVLILGDYMPSSTIKMLRLLESAVSQIAGNIVYTLKPHPNFQVKAADYPSLHLHVVMEPLGKILRNFEIAYSSNMTSAALDAHLAGLPVVVMLDETELNLSPLRGQPGARFVSTSEELAEALTTVRQRDGEPDSDHYFFLDPELPKWSCLLSN